MASKVMGSTTPTNPGSSPSSSSLIHHIRNHNSSSDFQHQHQNSGLFLSNDHINCNLSSMDDLIKNIYSESAETFPAANGNGFADGEDGGGEVAWGNLGNGESNNGGTMTLEDFLVKAGMTEEVRVPTDTPTGNFGMEGMMNSVPGMTMQSCPAAGFAVEPANGGFQNGMVAVGGTSGDVVARGGPGKRRSVADVPLDKATQQKQRRMIKNRESAARSRERKQAYTVELEALVNRLEEENARLLKEEAELKKQRFKQLMEEVKPAIEKRRPPRVVLRRSRSMSW